MSSPSTSHPGKVRYAVIALGDLAQRAVLPAFASAKANSILAALVSADDTKLEALSRQYRVKHTGNYRDLPAMLQADLFDAVYLALPSHKHCEFAVQAAEAGKHVLCEKPLAVTEDQCWEMIKASQRHQVKLMTAYRFHFERSNLKAIHQVRSGEIGDLRFFHAVFSRPVREGNFRPKASAGGGTLYDLGVYCINAARYLFRDEPTEGFAYSASGADRRSKEVDEMTSAVLRFPHERLATFTTSFGAAGFAEYTVVGTRGVLRLKHGFEHSRGMEMELTVDGQTERREFPQRNQFASELLYFSECILCDRAPEPSGVEGLIDVHIIRALSESADFGRPVSLEPFPEEPPPDSPMEKGRPGAKRIDVVRLPPQDR